MTLLAYTRRNPKSEIRNPKQKHVLSWFVIVGFLACFISTRVHGGTADFFKVIDLEYHPRPPKKGPTADGWNSELVAAERFARWRGVKFEPPVYQPLVQAQVEVQQRIVSSSVYAKAYFFDGIRRPLGEAVMPVKLGARNEWHPFPAFFEAQRKEPLFFPVPEKVLKTPGWTVVVVFGDEKGASAETLPRGGTNSFEFPEKQLVLHPEIAERKQAIDHLVEYPVKTKSPRNPTITLFLSLPNGVKDVKDIEGVLALCFPASALDQVRRRLSMVQDDDLSPVLRSAEQEKFAILCWASRRLWDPGKNWDDMSKDEYKAMDRELDWAAEAWSRGVKELGAKYGIPTTGYFLWGECASGQYVSRLALRVPEHFLAVYTHMPGSFDQPVPAANRLLWCITTGELYGGYERSIRFFQQARAAGYPILYKAIMGLGHSNCPAAQRMSDGFFKYALSLREERARFDAMMKDPLSPERRAWEKEPNRPWPEAFRNPPYYGDVVNQAVYPAKDIDLIPAGFRDPLPTKELADIWAMSDRR